MFELRSLFYLACDGGSLEVSDDQHLYMSDCLGRAVLLAGKGFRQAAFGPDKDGGLALASTPALERAAFLGLWRFGGEEASSTSMSPWRA